MKDDLLIIAIVYEEPEWQETKKLIESLNLRTLWEHRNPPGIGGLASPINDAIRSIEDMIPGNKPKYAWILTNVTFDHKIVKPMYDAMEDHSFAALHPAMANSDHLFKRPLGKNILTEAPYCEFTAPMVRIDVMREFPLNEDMPYWGHDLDWGYRVRQAGYTVAIDHGAEVKHEYIRDNFKKHPITTARMESRQRTNDSTTAKLVELYGPDWEQVLEYKK